ncbi:MAG: ABC transporter permease subunit [Actinomycetia bacterium]|nr:ABC transporter permease subunit [Actinomycetes bacterium]
MNWIRENWTVIFPLGGSHVILAGVPLLLGLLLSIPLGWAARRWRRAYPAIVSVSGLLYTIPSLALFILMPLILGTRILDPLNVVAAMTVYTVALLVRTVADGLGSVPDHVQQAATAMGYGRWRRFFVVELPLAVPVITAGLRVAAVSNVSIVSVASLIGVSQLGDLLIDGFNRNIPGALWLGIISCLVLALIFDVVITGIGRLLTPWTRAAS